MSKKVLHAEIPFDDFSSRISVGCEPEEVIEYFTSHTKSEDGILSNEGEVSILSKIVNSEVVNNITSQLQLIDDIPDGEIAHWKSTMYRPPVLNSKKKAPTPSLDVPSVELGCAIRYILNLSKYDEIIHVSVPKYNWEKKILLRPQKALGVIAPFCYICNFSFKNVTGESVLLHAKGHRPKHVKKNISERAVFSFDGMASLQFIKSMCIRFADKFGIDLQMLLSSLGLKE